MERVFLAACAHQHGGEMSGEALDLAAAFLVPWNSYRIRTLRATPDLRASVSILIEHHQLNTADLTRWRLCTRPAREARPDRRDAREPGCAPPGRPERSGRLGRWHGRRA